MYSGISYVCEGRVITWTQTMVVVDDRSMANVHVVSKRYLYSIISFYVHSFHRIWFANKLSHMILTLTERS